MKYLPWDNHNRFQVNGGEGDWRGRRWHFKFGKEKSSFFLFKCYAPFQAHWGLLSGTRALKMEKI